MQKLAPRSFSNVLIHNITSKCFLALPKKNALNIPGSALGFQSLAKILYLAACYNSYLGQFERERPRNSHYWWTKYFEHVIEDGGKNHMKVVAI